MLNKGAEVGPYIVMSDELEGFVLSVMSGQDMVMFILEDFESEVHNVWYINLIVLVEESAFVHSPVGCGGGWQVCCRDGIEV